MNEIIIRKLIKSFINEYVSQHENFNSNDLKKIGNFLISNLEQKNFIIRRSNVSFNNVFCFDAEKSGKMYLVFVKKKFHSINEDNDLQTFNREELKKLYPDLFKNKVSSNQLNGTIKNKNISNFSNHNSNYETEDTDIAGRDVYLRSFEYYIEFQDKAKNSDIVIQHKKVFNPKNESFEDFAKQIVIEVTKNF